MTLIARLCALCAISALMELLLGDNDARGLLRMVCGLLMLHLTFAGAQQLMDQLSRAGSLQSMLESLIQ